VGRKKTIYANAATSLAVRPLNEADFFVSTFTKCEKVDLITKSDPAPRVIQPRSPRAVLETGRFLKRMEKPLMGSIADVWGGPTVLKGLNPQAQAHALREMWTQFKRPVALGLDATRFDQHVNADLLRFEHTVYVGAVPRECRPKLRWLLDNQLMNRGYARCNDGTVVYEVAGRRMSGDINTGMGNCTLMTAIVWALRRDLNIPMRLANNGDDCVIIFDRRHLSKVQDAIESHFLKFGLVMEVEAPVYEFEKISFCQTQPVYDGSCWVMCRDPRTCMMKDLCTTVSVGSNPALWSKAVGDCGLAVCGGLPVMQNLYRLMATAAPTSKKFLDDPGFMAGLQMMAKGSSRTFNVPLPEARLSYWRAFGILPDLQSTIEEVWDREDLRLSAGIRSSPLESLKFLF
jgi:hypothetical protein